MNLDHTRYGENHFANLKKWSEYLQKIRKFLHTQGYLEVTTPSLVQAGAMESSIDTLKAIGLTENWELHTSPEMEMKKLLSLHPEIIFQITKCFRDDPDTPIHGKEFSLLEFYRMNETYDYLIKEVQNLFSLLSPLSIPFKTITVENLLLNTLGFKLSEYPTKEKLFSFLNSNKIILSDPKDSWEDLFFKIFIEKIEPTLDPNTAWIVKDYPTRTSTLSQPIPNSIYSERFEIYWQGMELCNGCTELRDPNVLHENYEIETSKRLLDNKKPHPYPETFIKSLPNLPECTGVAIGLDRLFLCIESLRK